MTVPRRRRPIGRAGRTFIATLFLGVAVAAR